MEIGFAAVIALWALSRSGFSARYVYPVEIKNPADKLTQGYIDNGRPVQPTYGKMKVGFEAPKAEKCYSSRTSKDGMRRYEVWKIAEQPSRVIVKVPAGYKGAGTEYNISSWITPNMGEGYYVMIRGMKVGRGGRADYSNWIGIKSSAEITALTQKAIGVSWVVYETAQRYIRHPNTKEGKEAAKAQMDELIAQYDSFYEPDDPTPEPKPEPEPPTLPPTIPPSAPPTTPPVDPNPPTDPQPLDPPTGGQPTFPPTGGQPSFPSFNRGINSDVNKGLNGDNGVSLMGDY